MFSALAESWLGWGCLGSVPRLGERIPWRPFAHLRQPVALKKTSGSTGSRHTLLLPEKGMMTRSASTGRASMMSSSFSSSVEDRFQSSPGGWGQSPNTSHTQEDPRDEGPTPQPTLAKAPTETAPSR